MTLEKTVTDASGRTWYRPVVARIKGTAPKSGDYILEGIDHYWKWGSKNRPKTPLTIGQVYEFILSTNPNPGYGDYHDISEASPTEDQPIAASTQPSNGSQRPEDDYRRSKEEMRWTECMHMATRINDQPADDGNPEQWQEYYRRWANWFYEILQNPPESSPETGSGASEPEEALFPEEPIGRVYAPGEMCPDHPASRLDKDSRHPLFDGREVTGWCPE